MPERRLVFDANSTSKRKNRDGLELRYHCRACRQYWSYEHEWARRHEVRCKFLYFKMMKIYRENMKDIGVSTENLEENRESETLPKILNATILKSPAGSEWLSIYYQVIFIKKPQTSQFTFSNIVIISKRVINRKLCSERITEERLRFLECLWAWGENSSLVWFVVFFCLISIF